MNPETYMFQAPLRVPKPQGNGSLFASISTDGDLPQIVWRRASDFPRVRNKYTGDTAHIVRGLTSNMEDLPKHGRISVVFEDILVLDGQKSPVFQWDPDEWEQDKREPIEKQ